MGLTVVPGPADILTAKYMIERDTINAVPPQTLAFIGAQTHSADHTEGATALIAMPAGLAAGDLMMLFVWKDGGTFQTPAGWRFVDSGAMATLYTKTAGASETTLTYTFATAPGDRSMVLRAYRGPISTPTIHVEVHLESANVSSVTAPQVAYTGGGMIVYGWGGFESFVATQVNAPVTLSHIVGTGALVVSCSTADETVTGSGSSVARTATGLGGGSNWTTFTVMLS